MNNSSHLKTQSGSSLIEVLIAVLVVSVGLLGLAGLQTQSLKSNHSSFIRSNVTHMGYDLGERMRLFEAEALNGDFNTGSARLTAWEAGLTNIVGNDVSTTVTQDTNQFTISIRWLESRGGIDAAANNYETFSYILDLEPTP